jgi:hypothetical protein
MAYPTGLAQKLRSYFDICGDDQLTYADSSFHALHKSLARISVYSSYIVIVEPLTLLPFLKMANEQTKSPFSTPSKQGIGTTDKPSPIPKVFGRDALLKPETLVSANGPRSTRLRQNFLQKAFTGELV